MLVFTNKEPSGIDLKWSNLIIEKTFDTVTRGTKARSNIYTLSFQLGKAATNSSLKPSSLSTSAVCSPNLGGGRRTAEGVRE